MKRTLAVSSALLAVLAPLMLLARSGQDERPLSGTVAVQLLAINDFHGNLEPPAGVNGQIGRTPAGGAEYLATHLGRAIARNPNSIVVAAGDLIGASPLLSALFHDEPTIESMNAMHVAVTSVGNHEFDDGLPELLRMQKGGCHPTDGCQDGDGFEGAAFAYLAANVVSTGTSSRATVLPATAVRTVGGVKIGFIGETLKGTSQIVRASGVGGLAFLDEASTANAYAAELKKQGVNAIVLLIHQGGEQVRGGEGAVNSCTGFRGGLAPIIGRLSADIKVVISGHTHAFYNCEIQGHVVTSASSFGRMFTRVDLTISRATGAIQRVVATNEIVTHDVAKDSAQTRIISKYAPIAAPLGSRVVGSVTVDLTRRPNEAGESVLGDVIADAQLAATSAPGDGGAVVAFMNPGGIRADIVADRQAGSEAPGEVTYGELFAVQPFKNVMTVVTMTGDAIRRLLEQQFDSPSPGETRFLQVSGGFSYRYTLHASRGHHVDPASIRLNGKVIAPAARVRVAASDFLIGGGDAFTVFRQGTDQVGGEPDVDALVAFVRSHSPVSPGPRNRIIRSPERPSP